MVNGCIDIDLFKFIYLFWVYFFVLDKLILYVCVGEILVLVGFFGVGKFILFDLLFCFVDCIEGFIKFDGVDIWILELYEFCGCFVLVL